MPTPELKIEKRTLERALGVPGLFSIGYGNVGSSIYYALGVVAAYALGATPIAFGIAAVFFVFTALTYAEQAGMFPESGGAATLVRHGFNEFVAFVAGWALMMDYIVTIAISAYSAVAYLGHFWPPLRDVPAIGAAFAILLVFFLSFINFVGVRESARLNNTLVAADLSVIILICLLGFALIFNLDTFLSWRHVESIVDGKVIKEWPDTRTLIYSISIAMIAFTGIASVTQMAEEAKDPRKTVPRAVFAVIAAVILVTVAVNLVAFSAMPPHELGSTYKLEPVQGIAHALGNKVPLLETLLTPVISILAFSILAIAANAGMLGVSRLAYSMGIHRQLPGLFYKLHPSYKTPHIAIVFYGAIAVALLATGFFSSRLIDNLADLYAFGSMLSFSFAHAAILALRWKEPERERAFKLPLNVRFRGREIPITPILGLLGTLSVFVVVVVTHPWARTMGLFWLGGGVLMYAFHRQREELPLTTTVVVTGVEPILVPMALKRVLVPTIGTAFSEEMVAVACRLAKRERATVRALYIYEVPPSLPVTELPAEEEQKGSEILQRALQIGEGLGVNVELVFLQGRKAGQLIVTEAEQLKADVILMGLDPERRIQERVGGAPAVGKTVEYVLKHSNSRILLSRPPRAVPGEEAPSAAAAMTGGLVAE
ncbi:MAG: universal stress protein [Candidatus Sericytochromatia bacterium]|nr:universal stress protein [Candidatus Tanganyikabacteria bacterium]